MENLVREVFENSEEHGKFLREYLSLQTQYNAAIKEVTTKLEILDDEFHFSYEHNPIHNIETRLKSPKSILEKLKKYGVPYTIESVEENIKDLAGVRVVCNYIDDIYTIASLLTSQGDITLEIAKDYIKNPKPNGYRSLHLIVKVPVFLSKGVKNIPVEVQIRTIAMDFWASLEHDLRYKGGDAATKDIVKRLTTCAESIAEIDLEMQDIHNTIQEKKIPLNR